MLNNLNVVNGKVVGFDGEEKIYIGRKYFGLKASILANPYIIGKDGTRAEVVEKYRQWLWQEYQKNGAVRAKLEAIADRVLNGEKIDLVCWCAPGKCHGDVIKNCITWMINSGEIPNNSPRLTIELVPSTCWFSNVRSNVSKRTWDRLRKETYKQADYRCEICGGVGPNHPVECHEVWHYDDIKHVQRLSRLIALCPACHQCKHMGLAQINGKEVEALEHLAEVNNWEMWQAIEYAERAFEIWSERSKHQWKLDISYLEKLGVEINNFACLDR